MTTISNSPSNLSWRHDAAKNGVAFFVSALADATPFFFPTAYSSAVVEACAAAPVRFVYSRRNFPQLCLSKAGGFSGTSFMDCSRSCVIPRASVATLGNDGSGREHIPELFSLGAHAAPEVSLNQSTTRNAERAGRHRVVTISSRS